MWLEQEEELKNQTGAVQAQTVDVQQTIQGVSSNDQLSQIA